MANFLTRLFQPQITQQQFNDWAASAFGYIGPVTPVYPDIDQREAILTGYLGNTDIYTIVSRKASMCAAIPFYEYQIRGNEGAKYLNQYKQLMNSPGGKNLEEKMFQAQLLKTKALEQVDNGSALNKLLSSPNADQSQQELFEIAYGYLALTGNSYLGKLRLEAGANQGKVQELYSLPSQYMKIYPNGQFPLGVDHFEYFLITPIPLPKEDVMHVKYFNPDVNSTGSQLYGLSPIRANRKLLKRANSEIDSTVSQFENGGPPAIVYNEDAKTDPKVHGIVKKGYFSEMAGNTNRGKLFFAGGKMGILQTGLSPVDLKILESSTITFRKLCAIWGMPSALLNDNEHTTEANMDEFQKLAYTHGCIPDVLKWRDTLNRSLLPDFGLVGKSFIDADFSNISALQPDMKTLAEWLNLSPEITLNERREMKKFDRLNDPNMDKVYVPSTWTSLDDLNMAQPEDLSGAINNLDNAELNPYRQQ